MSIFEISVDATYKCPFSCPFCSSHDNNLAMDMNLNIARKCLDFVYKVYNPKIHPVTITITGGEPLILDKLPLFISMWSKENNMIILCTTAALDMGRGYWEYLYSCGLQTVRLSLHSISNENSHVIFGGKYSFSIVERNIELIKAAGITLNANFLVSKLSLKNFDGVLDYCFKKDIKKIRILGLCKQGRAKKNWERISLSYQEEAILVERISELSNKYGISVEFAGLPNHKWCTHSDENGECLGGLSFFHINTNGDIYPCPAVKSKAHKKIGTILDSKVNLLKQSVFSCSLERKTISLALLTL